MAVDTTKQSVSSIYDISSTNNPAKSQSEKSAVGLGKNYNDFLTLLTTQLKNQDPTEPMDTNQFTQQLVNFTGVEQQVNTNKNLETLLQLTKDTQTSNAIISGSSLIGRTVEAKGDTTSLVNGKANFSYTLPANVSSSFIRITDADNKLVYSTGGSIQEGKQTFTWNGRDNNGNQLPEGAYRIQVNAMDKNNDTVTVTTAIKGKVTGVQVADGGGAVISIGEAKVSINNITALYPDEI